MTDTETHPSPLLRWCPVLRHLSFILQARRQLSPRDAALLYALERYLEG